MATIDIIVFVLYCAGIIALGLWVSRDTSGHGKDTQDYFLASKSLPWWVIGASLIAANISAEQFIGMSGSGFAIGLAISSYEWMAALTLLIVGKFFLPIFIKKELYTIPEFVEKRFSTNLKTILAVFWIGLYVFVNLTTVLYLGARALDTIWGSGDGSMLVVAVIGLALFAAAYSLWGGLAAVAWTDVVQHVSPDGSILGGFQAIYDKVPAKFSMILDQNEIITPDGKDAWDSLPGLAVLIGGMWVANLYYWGFNQYIIQRALAAKSLKEAQKGIAFAAFLKILMPLIVVVPGIVAFVMNMSPEGVATLDSVDASFIQSSIGPNGEVIQSIVNDNAAPWLIGQFIPAGLKGLVVAALAAAIVSSLASMLNSTATIFTMDIYKPYINKGASEKTLVTTGRISASVALLIAVLIAPQLKNLGEAFQFIQEYTGVVSPGILAVFLLGLFWKKTTNNAAIWGAILSIPIALYFKVGPKGWSESALFVDLPFMDQMMWTLLLSMGVILLVSYLEGKGAEDEKGIPISRKLFATDPVFNISAAVVCVILAVLYAVFW
jgi:solute:Na+ symporter, SSS family